MATFYLKYRDTLPTLQVSLLNPDATPFDLTGSTAWKLHIRLSDATTILTRDMTKVGLDTAGVLSYSWQSTDWNAGALTVGIHRMEYEVIGPASTRLTFPNWGWDHLEIVTDIGQS